MCLVATLSHDDPSCAGAAGSLPPCRTWGKGLIDVFSDRIQAGRLLAHEVLPLKLVDPVVRALLRGSVPVAAEVAYALHALLDVLLARKFGAPSHRELAVAAVAERPQTEVMIDQRPCT